MNYDFFKMEGLGNDYVYMPCLDSIPEELPALAREISDRHFGVGGDGLVVVTHSDVADFRMIMFNADGSEAQMCGNASRCIARLVYDKGLTSKQDITLETRAGIKQLRINLVDGEFQSVSVNMGKPFLEAAEIPTLTGKICQGLTKHDIEVGNREIEVWCVGMGNPHGVIFMDVTEEFFRTYGPQIENHRIWPEKANIEFVKVVDSANIDMRVWERGTGETLACGTGACAAAVASILLAKTGNDVQVRMKGGNLNIKLSPEGDIIMTGPARLVAQGVYFSF